MTDQSGAFPETLREAVQRFLDLKRALGTVIAPALEGALDELRAALERPRPAPPEPSEAAVQAAERAQYEHMGNVKGRGAEMVHWCACGLSWPDKQPRGDGDDSWGRHVNEMQLRAAYAVDFGGTAGIGAAPPDHDWRICHDTNCVVCHPNSATILEASPAVTRIEVIDHRHGVPSVGRVFTAWGAKVALAYQDNGRTLKVFVSDRGGAAQPPPSAPKWPASRCMECGGGWDDAGKVYAFNTNCCREDQHDKLAWPGSGVPREETK